MITNYNKKKNLQLNMSYGKANNILRRMIMLNLLQKLGKDICYRCNKKINTVFELSIEHKQAWLDSNDPVKMFFDLNNISFSHLLCNNKHKRYHNKIIVPDGMFYCYKCKKIKNINESNKSCRKYGYICKECHKLKMRILRKIKKEHRNAVIM